MSKRHYASRPPHKRHHSTPINSTWLTRSVAVMISLGFCLSPSLMAADTAEDALIPATADPLLSDPVANPEGTLVAAALPALRPFRAEYQARYNGKNIGRALIELNQDPPPEPATDAGAPAQGFHLRYRMEATRGFASFVGANLREEGRFAWDGSAIVPQQFRHQSKAFLSKTTWDAQFSLPQQQVAGRYEGDDYRLTYAPGTLDPLTQFIFGAQQSMQEAASWSHLEVMKGELREYHFMRDALAPLENPCAPLQAWRVQRNREVSKASQEIWYSPASPWVPVQLRNVQKDGDELQLELTGLELDGRLFCGRIDRSQDS